MGRRGPAPDPARVKLAKGETRPSRVNYNEIVPTQARPRMPAGMPERAKSVWRQVLDDMPPDVIVTVDSYVLRAFAETVARYERYSRMVNDTGPLIQGRRRGEWVRNPIVQFVREEREAMRLLARELGLTPAARANLRIDTAAQSSDMDAILGPSPRLAVVNG